MRVKCGILGLPNIGKSTLFNALCSTQVPASNFPFCTIEPNVGIISVPDPNPNKIAHIIHSAKSTPAPLQIVDIAGLVKGASRGEGLGNQFLSHVREVDALIHLVRCFFNDDISHVDGTLNPLRDMEVIQTELLLADLQTVGKKLEKEKKAARVGDKTAKKNSEFLELLEAHMNQGNPARSYKVDPLELPYFRQLFLLTEKPVLYVANSSGSKDEKELTELVSKFAEKENADFLVMDCKLEAEITSIPIEEREEFLSAMESTEPGLNRLIASTFKLLGLISFYTANSNEVRAWTIKKGIKAPQAAGVIHSDFERGFICAECCRIEDLLRLGSEQKVRHEGLWRQEGKEYIVEQGDILLFRFNV